MKTPKNNIVYILLSLSGYVIMYMSITFIRLEFNILLWNIGDRIVLVLLGTFLSIIAFVIKTENNHEN